MVEMINPETRRIIHGWLPKPPTEGHVVSNVGLKQIDFLQPTPPTPDEHDYIIFWERLANSGVIRGCRAKSPEKAVDMCGFNTDFVKHTVVDGKIIAIIGKEG